MFKQDLVESEIYPGFYHHPTIDDVALSKSGKVVDTLGKVCPLIRVNSDGYLTVNLRGRGTHRVHTLVAETFLSPPVDPVKCLVNHKDGNKANADYLNLEWADYSDNILHAYITGLRDDNTPIMVKDLGTDEIVEYYSLQDAARAFGVNGSAIYRYLSNNERVPWRYRYELIRKGDDWRGLTIDDIGRVNNGQSREVVVEKDGCVYLMGSISDASRHFGVSLFKLYSALDGGSPKMDIKVWYAYNYSDSLADAVVVEAHRSKIVRPNFKRVAKPIRVSDTVDGGDEWWESISDFAKSVGVGKSTIQKSMAKNDGRWRQFKIEYID